MAMLDIQRRHAEVFRIRLGDKTQKGAPRKLTDSIRVTAPNQRVIEAFVDVYGGEVTPWEKQFQAYLPTTELRILVLPGQSIQQWWEKYRGSVCERRCDGFQEQKSGNRCMCPEDIDARVADRNACSPTTRVNVLCPDVGVVGSGALVTHGIIAAETLPQSIAVAETALSRGLMVPAVLRVVEHRGRNHFIVPQIEIVGVSLNTLTAGELPHATETPVAELEGAARPALTPVPMSLPTGPQQSVAEQAAAVVDPPPAKPRKNAAVPMAPTGLAPRTVAEAAGEDVQPTLPADDADAADVINEAQVTKAVVTCKEAGLEDEGRHSLVAIVTGGRTESSKELTKPELDQLLVICELMVAGHVGLSADGEQLLRQDNGEAMKLPLDVNATRKWLAQKQAS